MKGRIPLWLAAILLPAVPQASSLSGRVDLASDALFRGFRENNGPSFAVRADYGYGAGLYLGGTVANDRKVGDGRLDLRAGIAQSLQFAGYLPYRVDAGVSGSLFSGGGQGPFGRDPDYVEAYGGLTLGPATGNVAVSPDYYGLGGAGYRIGGVLRLPLLPSLSFSTLVAWNGGEGVRRYVAVRTGGRHASDYYDYGVTVGFSLPRAFSVYAQAAGTSLAGDRVPHGLVGFRKDFDF